MLRQVSAILMIVACTLAILWDHSEHETDIDHHQGGDSPEVIRSTSSGMTVASVFLPKGSRLVLGSLDQTAAEHAISLTVRTADATDANSSPLGSLRFLTVDAPLPEARLQPPAFEPLSPPDDLSMYRPQEISYRRFRSPYFSSSRSFDRFVRGKLTAESRRVRVFVEEERFPDERFANVVCHLVEQEILDHIEARVCTMADIDGDGHLTVFVGHLADNLNPADDGEPVLGCVRGSDFNSEGPFFGDIVYLDDSLRDREDLRGILAHEITHAAVFSATVSNSRISVPSWLNEAIAHAMELEVDPESPNMRRRTESFLRETHRFPVVVPERPSSVIDRRGPTRAAACSFLTHALRHGRSASLKSLLRSENADSFRAWLQAPEFRECFRQWSLAIAATLAVRPDSRLENTELTLLGTSFVRLPAATTDSVVKVCFPSVADLQATIMKPVPQLAKGFSADDSGQAIRQR